MMVRTAMMVVMVAVAAVGAAFGLEGGLHPCKIGPEAMEHILDHMVGPNAKNTMSNFSRQMPISQMPGKAHKLIGILVPHFDNRLRSGLHLQPSAIVKLQAVSIGYRNRFRKVEKENFELIRHQPNAPAMASIEIEREGACRSFLRPMSGRAMN
jgi:hypothetical protein